MPQLPQWAGEDAVSTQAPPQLAMPPTQPSEHALAEQTLPTGHLVSQAPQRCGSLLRSTHAPLQLWRVP